MGVGDTFESVFSMEMIAPNVDRLICTVYMCKYRKGIIVATVAEVHQKEGRLFCHRGKVILRLTHTTQQYTIHPS